MGLVFIGTTTDGSFKTGRGLFYILTSDEAYEGIGTILTFFSSFLSLVDVTGGGGSYFFPATGFAFN
jgi:hypothetical protein